MRILTRVLTATLLAGAAMAVTLPAYAGTPQPFPAVAPAQIPIPIPPVADKMPGRPKAGEIVSPADWHTPGS